jgi:hypothetical protein
MTQTQREAQDASVQRLLSDLLSREMKRVEVEQWLTRAESKKTPIKSIEQEPQKQEPREYQSRGSARAGATHKPTRLR